MMVVSLCVRSRVAGADMNHYKAAVRFKDGTKGVFEVEVEGPDNSHSHAMEVVRRDVESVDTVLVTQVKENNNV